MQSVNNSEKFEELYEIIKRLRGPGGCPWDQKQSPASIKKYLLEETRELAEAIDKGDKQHICEEIGDLFFILLMLMQMYEQSSHFTSHDVFDRITRKMIRRHPHVFAGQETGSESELKKQWEAIKSQEKKKS